MDMMHDLPFKVGQHAESKSFLTGYRGAWFRCKIKNISFKKGQIGHVLEFFDFPDEKVRWTKLYQKPPTGITNYCENEVQLMVRPCFPSIYHESQMPESHMISEVVAIMDDVWKVGDLVDWWTDGCYWSGRVTQLLGEDKVQIALLEPPLGEGNSYEAFYKDLRPSMDWSPEHGWTVPVSMVESENSRYCARLIYPMTQDDGKQDNDHSADKTPCKSSTSISSHDSPVSLPPIDISEDPPVIEILKQPSCNESNKEQMDEPQMNGLNLIDLEQTGFSDGASSSREKEAPTIMVRTTKQKDRYSYSGSSKKMRFSGELCLNSMNSDTIESSLLDLEELANRIKWLKEVLNMGFPLPNGEKPSWEFLENRASFIRR